MKYVTRCALTLAFAWSAVALGATTAAHGSISRVLGSITIGDGEQAGDLETVNGSVKVGTGAHAGSVVTVNGFVGIADRAVVSSAETVNGRVLIGEAAQVDGDVETVNGSMTLRRDARVAGHVQNVNGTMLLEGAEVRGGLDTVNGDIRLQSGSRVDGGIHIEANSSTWDWSRYSHNPRITIEPGVVVQGPLHFEREVDLYVAPGVTLPEVQGVAPRRFVLEADPG